MAVVDHPIVVFAISLLAMAITAFVGSALARRGVVDADAHEYFAVVQTATLTLFGLVVGFTFSMAVNRYDQRKNYEEEEANAIGTAYVRVELMPAAEASQAQAKLRDYLQRRIAWYGETDAERLREIDKQTGQLQNELWATVRGPATMQPNPVMALVASGMNDVLNSQGYTQAAWWNRIPRAAWLLMLALAACSNLLVGMGSKPRAGRLLLLILPFIVALAFLLIADIDSPRRGMIAVSPRNLLALAQSLAP
ncbi:hypothetical protein [Roseateles violae]